MAANEDMIFEKRTNFEKKKISLFATRLTESISLISIENEGKG